MHALNIMLNNIKLQFFSYFKIPLKLISADKENQLIHLVRKYIKNF